jgi:hypothetical protein
MLEITYKEVLWIITILILAYWHGKYIVDTYKWTTTPHLFSWIIFFITGSIAFLIQYQAGAWPWAWSTSGTIVTATIIIFLSLKQWEKNITFTDTISFVFGLWAIALYLWISSPIYALLLVTLINIFAFYPTFRKSYRKPSEETLIAYIFAAARSFISIFALSHISLLTIITPIFIVIINVVFVTMVYIRKKQLHK